MKNHFAFIFSAFFLLTIIGLPKAHAQAMFGIRGGFAASKYAGTGTDKSFDNPLAGSYKLSQSSIIGPEAGIYMLIPLLGNTLSFQPGVDYYRAGTLEKQTFTLGSLKAYRGINYVSVPILLRLAYAGETFRLYVNGGVFASYAFSGRIKLTGEVLSIPSDEDRDVDFNDDKLSQSDLGAILGAGFMFRTGPVWLGLDLRYHRGLMNMNTDSKTKDDYKPQNNVLSPSVNLYIPLKRQ